MRLSTYIHLLHFLADLSEKNTMNGNSPYSPNSTIFILGALINSLALSDISGLVDYSLKALVGGCIWLGFKLLSDYISQRIHKKNNTPSNENKNLIK